MRHTYTTNDATEIVEAADDAGWIVLHNGFQAGGTVDASGAGDRVFDTRTAAIQYARENFKLATVRDYARAQGLEVHTLDVDETAEVGAEVCEVSRASYGRLERAGKAESTDDPATDCTLFIVPGILSGSDYSGSSVELSNYRTFLESWRNVPGVVDLHGGHGTYAIAIRLDVCEAGILQALEALDDYPVLDDDAMGEVEAEQDREAWESWARDDFKRELERRHGVDVSEVSDDDIARVFLAACEATGNYFECDGADRFIRVEQVAPGCTLDSLRGLAGAVECEDAEDIRTRAERDDAQKSARSKITGRWGGGHTLKRDPRDPWTRRNNVDPEWTPRHDSPAASVCECKECGRTGWVNVRPVDGAPTSGGPIFAEHCGHGLDPDTHCPDCGELRDAPAGTVGAWNAYGYQKPGERCTMTGHARPTAPADSTDANTSH